MADYKISQLTPVTPTSDDLLEVSHTTDSGVTYNTGSVSVDTLSSAVADNITAADIEYSSGVSVADKIDDIDEIIDVVSQTYPVATYGGTIKFTKQGNIVTLQAIGIGTSQAISAVGVITLLSDIDERFLPANDIYIAGFRTSGYSTDHFQGYRLRDTTQKTLISYVYTSKPIDNGCFTVAYSV